jgi:hypothetical protein
MPRKVVVTGYVPIANHPRSAEEYGRLGELFGKIDCGAWNCTLFPFYEQVEDTWLAEYLAGDKNITHSTGDNPQKNSLAYHCVNHQKFGWLVKAAMQYPADTYIWMDYGIGHLPGVTPAVIQKFLEAVELDDFAIPGCWEREGLVIDDLSPCWRFCGSLFIVPKNKVHELYRGVKRTLFAHLNKTHNVPWEVNTLALAEPSLPPIRWYRANHDKSMFENYKI